MSSYSYAETFTRAHARRLAGRVTTDLRQSYLLYGSPTEDRLEQYRAELEELLSPRIRPSLSVRFPARRYGSMVTALCSRTRRFADWNGDRRQRSGAPEYHGRDVLQFPHLLRQLV